MDAIAELQNRLSGAYARNTLRGYAADLRIFQAWCTGQALEWLPATPTTVVAFITAEANSSSVATINRRISAIARLHRAFGHDDPVKSEAVHLALRRVRRQKPRRPRQALGLTAEIRDAMVAACPDNLAGKRDRALVMLAYDTLRRRSELVELQIEDIHPLNEGAAILVRRSKTDQEGRGHLAYLSPPTLEAINSWLTVAALKVGPIIRSVLVGGRIGQRLRRVAAPKADRAAS